MCWDKNLLRKSLIQIKKKIEKEKISVKAKKVLVFPAGTEIAFEILNALKYSKFVELYGGISTDDHSEFVYKNLIKGFPYITPTAL